ncbi:hypothetical protein [Photobacterium chitinilyticum]|uniref:Uncharacterized protein n=1 Tax=Photobacterium chitinilyticum TaxID=2485123 RepID=A0A3S3R379_9GAMM|nr:hypothetical protein [Photobacterium chitinilyticum]RWX57276.1 hypothetical protein EDI28_04380 [Photobacterium chitinilyticum]
MAITIRDTDKHYFMIEELKALTNSNVTTKALIQGGYMAVELGKQYEEEKEKRLKIEAELATLKETVNQYLSSQQALINAIN